MTSTISDHEREIRPTFLVGAAGRLGAMVSAYWPKDAALVRSARKAKPEFIILDLILAPKMAPQAMAGAGAVICLAGVTPAQVASGKDVFSRNTDLAVAAIHAAYEAGAGRVFVASSAAVYGAATGILDETAQCKPLSDYGQTKLDMERAVLESARMLGHPATVLRIGNVAGADAILGGWRDGMQIDTLPDGGTPKRSYIGPQTLTRVLYELCQITDLPDVLNIAAPEAVGMGALLDAADLPWTSRPAAKTVISDVTLCTKQLEKYVTFAPENSTPAGLAAEWRVFQTLS